MLGLDLVGWLCLVYENISLYQREKAYVYVSYARCLWSI